MRGLEQAIERGLLGPGLGQVQRDPARGAGEACRHVDEGATDRRGRRLGEPPCLVGDDPGSAGEVEPDDREHEPGAVRGEHSRRQVRERSLFEVGVDLLDDRVAAMGGAELVGWVAGGKAELSVEKGVSRSLLSPGVPEVKARPRRLNAQPWPP